MSDLHDVGPDNSSPNQNSEQNKIVWVESEDVYKPIPKSIEDFKSERDISSRTQKEKVYITKTAVKHLTGHLGSNTTVEQGGILFGNAYEDPQYGIYVEIKSAVAAPSTIGTGAHLEFTSDSWQGIMDYAKTTHPQENIVGWYHSHPNLGVFMSGTDMNTQRAFFHHPWCVSIVCDPVRRKIGYFLGKNAESVQVVEFGSGDAENILFPEPADRGLDSGIEYLPEEETNKDKDIEQKEQSTNQRNSSTFLGLLLFGLLFILMAGMFLDFVLKTAFNNAISQSNPNISNSSVNQPEAGGNLSNSDTSTEGNYEFNAEYIRMPIATYKKLEANQNVLHSPIIKPQTNIGDGDEIIVLVIEQDVNSIAKNVTLEIERVILKDKEIQLIDSVKIPDNIPDEMISKTLEPITENLGNLSNGKAVLVLISSSYLSKNPSSQIVVRDIVNIPRRLIYEDNEGNENRIKVRKILK
ncbi:MAG: hypothetical protein F6K23_06635 [Okeania sp. SIO2C9]|uniref:Mov34/MPN/PAD-1 family protein n=1 Tax=Okeania sp. SIO2C9 TaxID=2607791 RepID=UPI0013C158C8|nr:Mov34/MPN/PAD-1 family protein [Okeania sp. SIO2C9]NEQ72774.1 hypothetical protein [Okeania sp. SIO2C9]